MFEPLQAYRRLLILKGILCGPNRRWSPIAYPSELQKVPAEEGAEHEVNMT